MDGRQGPAYGSQPSSSYSHPNTLSSALVIPFPQVDFPELSASIPSIERKKRQNSKLTWPEKIMAYQIGFALESLLAAVEKFVG